MRRADQGWVAGIGNDGSSGSGRQFFRCAVHGTITPRALQNIQFHQEALDEKLIN